MSTATNTCSSTFIGLPVIPLDDPSLTSTSPIPRSISKIYPASSQSERVGAQVRRSIGIPAQKHLTPFLMLDHFFVTPGSGFSEHPHRGQETITYMLSGAMEHEDFTGEKGLLNQGDLQFMTAGRGIVHAEMPTTDPDVSVNIGMQLWVDLPAELKDVEPRYRDLRKAEIPTATSADGKTTVRVISGRALGVDSLKELAYTPVWYLDVTIQPGGKFEENIPSKWNSFCYVISGKARFGPIDGQNQVVEEFNNLIWDTKGDRVFASVDDDMEKEVRFILLAGLPLQQDIVQYGPFVATSQEGINKALSDYRSYSNGFERARGWVSGITGGLH